MIFCLQQRRMKENLIIIKKIKAKMKKVLFMAASIAMAAMTVVSCDNGASKNLKDEVDTIAYDFGVAQSEGLKQYMTLQLGVDSAYTDEFIKGMKEGAMNEAEPKKDAYMEGLKIGRQLQQMAKGLSQTIYADDSTKSVNVKCILDGLIGGLKGTEQMTAEDANTEFNEKIAMRLFGDNKKAGEEYLAANKKKEGVKTTASGLQYKVLVEGTGELPSDSAILKVNYYNTCIMFDSSYSRNQPLEVNMGRPGVIPGWVEALKLMPAGSKWEVTIPQELAYGSQNIGDIKPYSTLIFTIEVVK